MRWHTKRLIKSSTYSYKYITASSLGLNPKSRLSFSQKKLGLNEIALQISDDSRKNRNPSITVMSTLDYVYMKGQVIKLKIVFPNYGGVYFALICPKCNKTRRKLYIKPSSLFIRCRECLGIPYFSQIFTTGDKDAEDYYHSWNVANLTGRYRKKFINSESTKTFKRYAKHYSYFLRQAIKL